MKLENFQYVNNKWSVSEFPPLDSENTLIIVFAAPKFINETKPFETLSRAYPKSIIVGCSTAGEIMGASVSDDTLTVAVTQFDKTTLKATSISIDEHTDSFQAGERIIAELNGEDLKGIFILSDGLKTNGSELVRGLNTIHNDEVIITGGLAADGKMFQQTWTIFNGKSFSGNVIGIGFYGDYVKIGHGSHEGWDSFGPERVVTKAKGNILFELDGQPALSLYKTYLGERASELPSVGLLFPLGVRENKNATKQVIRTILNIDEKNNALILAGDVVTGSCAQLLRANLNRLIMGANEAGKNAKENQKDNLNEKEQPTLLIAISCVGRRILLGDRTEEEVESTLNSFPKGTSQIGFYSYGELAPYKDESCSFQNQSMTLTTICEESILSE